MLILSIHPPCYTAPIRLMLTLSLLHRACSAIEAVPIDIAEICSDDCMYVGQCSNYLSQSLEYNKL